MKNVKIILFLWLSIIGQQLSAQTDVRKPADVFGMYFETFVKNDQEALNRLNDYLKPTVEGKNAYEIDFKRASEDMVKASTDSFLSSFSKETANACRQEAEEYFKVLMDNFKQGKIVVTSSNLVQNEYVAEQKIAEIVYSVSFKVPTKVSDMPGTDTNKVKPKELKKYLLKTVQQFKTADKTVTTEKKFSLYQLKEGEKVYYWNGSPDEMVAELTDVYFESFGPK